MPKRRVVRHEVTQPVKESYRLIPLTQGQNAIVDLGDFDWLSQWNWYAKWDAKGRCFYAYRTAQSISMQSQILNCFTKIIDHANHNTLDNRRQNIRTVTSAQSAMNKRAYKNGSSFKGVSWRSDRRKWRAVIHRDGKQICIGNFETAEAAAHAYDKLAKEHHGEFAVLNFPKK